MTAVLSVAVNVVIGTVSEVAVAGMTKAVTIGAVESGRVIIDVFIVKVVSTPLETFLAASLAQAYNFFDPVVEKAYEVGGVDDQELEEYLGAE